MEKKKAKMAEDKLGMEPAVHRKELEKRIDNLEKDMGELIGKVSAGFGIIDNLTSDIIKKVNKMCKRFGIRGL